jgi:hypothetical protein
MSKWLPSDETLIIKLYLHGDKETAYAAGERAGLTGDALRMFSYASSEHVVEYIVKRETGEASPEIFDGCSLVPDHRSGQSNTKDNQ